jgi:hypothetical protein
MYNGMFYNPRLRPMWLTRQIPLGQGFDDFINVHFELSDFYYCYYREHAPEAITANLMFYTQLKQTIDHYAKHSVLAQFDNAEDYRAAMEFELQGAVAFYATPNYASNSSDTDLSDSTIQDYNF